MNNSIKIAIASALYWMLLTPAAVAQQADDTTSLTQLADKLRAATAASASKQGGTTKKQKTAAKNKKKKVAAKKQKISGKGVAEAVAVQQKAEVSQQPVVEIKPEDPAVKIRAEAQAIAKAAAQAQAAVQIQIADNSQVAKSPPFNRTMRLPDTYNLPPAEDGIHDPANEEGIKVLHAPLQAFADLPRRNTGNRVDWVAALNDKKISPRWDRNDAQAEGMVMDMDIVRVPRGSMPNVVFPHKQHTEWLVCSNCHPAIFVPQKGANQINMRQILSGEKCGVCHGKVAFPPSECRLCHSRKKDLPQDVADAP